MTTNLKFYGTIEFLLKQRAAIISLTDASGEFAGAERIEARPLAFETTKGLRDRLFEMGYSRASGKAADKGGRLETFRKEA